MDVPSHFLTRNVLLNGSLRTTPLTGVVTFCRMKREEEARHQRESRRPSLHAYSRVSSLIYEGQRHIGSDDYILFDVPAYHQCLFHSLEGVLRQVAVQTTLGSEQQSYHFIDPVETTVSVF